ncbi:hypothetical protein PybrP1_005608 [[Pythium] brassicae (nom. inval.)]|nr:hypothetical protein PybrP1_005608 [[Pythium] brassicae (nom. inval.)]
MKPGESPSDAKYPSLEAPSAPLLDHLPPAPPPPQQQQQQHFEHVPLARPVPAAPSAYLAPSADNARRTNHVRTTLRLMVFHALNASLAFIAFATVVVGTVVSIALLPLCCLGVFIFRVLLYLVGFLAELDVGIYNFIAPPEQHAYLSIPRRAAVLGISGERLSPELSSFSPLALLATLYFATIKFGLGILSALSLSLAVSWPLNALSEGELPDGFDGFSGFFWFVVLSLGFLIIGVSLMHATASLSRRATRYFCCEKFSTYRYVHMEGNFDTAPSYGAVGAFNA